MVFILKHISNLYASFDDDYVTSFFLILSGFTMIYFAVKSYKATETSSFNGDMEGFKFMYLYRNHFPIRFRITATIVILCGVVLITALFESYEICFIKPTLNSDRLISAWGLLFCMLAITDEICDKYYDICKKYFADELYTIYKANSGVNREFALSNKQIKLYEKQIELLIKDPYAAPTMVAAYKKLKNCLTDILTAKEQSIRDAIDADMKGTSLYQLYQNYLIKPIVPPTEQHHNSILPTHKKTKLVKKLTKQL